MEVKCEKLYYSEKEKVTNKMKMFNFLSTLFGNESFISQESPILADFENMRAIYIKVNGILTLFFTLT